VSKNDQERETVLTVSPSGYKAVGVESNDSQTPNRKTVKTVS
jgi:hypothetical protein